MSALVGETRRTEVGKGEAVRAGPGAAAAMLRSLGCSIVGEGRARTPGRPGRGGGGAGRRKEKVWRRTGGGLASAEAVRAAPMGAARIELMTLSRPRVSVAPRRQLERRGAALRGEVAGGCW